MTLLQQRTLQVAKRQLGFRESTGHNDGWVARLVQRFVARGAKWLDNAPWCCCFATWCIHQAAKEIGAVVLVPPCASSSLLYRWYRQHGRLLREPIEGCVGMIRGGRTGHEHTFLVHAVDRARGHVVGVDGNWRNSVCWTHHPISECDFGQIC
jgi:hypothetical protein